MSKNKPKNKEIEELKKAEKMNDLKTWLLIIVFVVSTIGFYFYGNVFPTKTDQVNNIQVTQVEGGKMYVYGKESNQYKELSSIFKTNEKVNLEFLSFFCPHCYDFEYSLMVNDYLKKGGVKLDFVPVEFMSKNSILFNQSYALLESLLESKEIDTVVFEKHKKAIFDLAQSEFGFKVSTYKDLYDFSFKELMPFEKFEALTYQMPLIKEKMENWKKLNEILEIRSVPAFYTIEKTEENIKLKQVVYESEVFKNLKTDEKFKEVLLKVIKNK